MKKVPFLWALTAVIALTQFSCFADDPLFSHTFEYSDPEEWQVGESIDAHNAPNTQPRWLVRFGRAEIASWTKEETSIRPENSSQVLRLVGGSRPSVEVSRVQYPEPAANIQITYVDFLTRPIVEPRSGAQSSFHINGSILAFVEDTEGQDNHPTGLGSIAYFSPPTSPSAAPWKESKFKFPLVPGTKQAVDWIRITIRHDMDPSEPGWDLYINGQMFAANIPLESFSELSRQSVFFGSESRFDILLDNFKLTAGNPIEADADNDGIFDRWEDAWDPSHTPHKSIAVIQFPAKIEPGLNA